MLDAALFLRLIDLIMAKDLDGVLALFAEDAVLVDPHYPEPRMQGRAAIERGIRWGLASLEKPGFSLRHLAVNGDLGFFEVDTKHKLSFGPTIAFEQVFVMQTRDGRITRLQAYEPYPAPGIAGLVRRATRLAWRLRGWI